VSGDNGIRELQHFGDKSGPCEWKRKMGKDRRCKLHRVASSDSRSVSSGAIKLKNRSNTIERKRVKGKGSTIV